MYTPNCLRMWWCYESSQISQLKLFNQCFIIESKVGYVYLQSSRYKLSLDVYKLFSCITIYSVFFYFPGSAGKVSQYLANFELDMA